MPSAAIRQRLPAELWKYPQSSNKSPVPSHSSQIQAHPGCSELFEASAQKNPHQNLVQRQFTPSSKKKKRSLQRRGSSDDVLNHSDKDLSRSNETARVSVSACSDSESGVSYNSSTECSDLYATDSFKAPDVNVLPLPPTQWLGVLHKNNGKSHALNDASLQLQAYLGMVPAERRI